MSTQLVWLRQDLRLADQPAFAAAARVGPVLALYVLDDVTPGKWRIGGAQRWWLHHSLAVLGKELLALVFEQVHVSFRPPAGAPKAAAAGLA